ncbi:MAG: tripartite tricarboxylate transporter substrate binding protein [Betaproteobacteria bacterium]|nr:tripartite tricarboxylate transporter substrate binding protein [Betaproteobacteria bacterium]
MRIITGFAPGGAGDVVARILAPKLSAILGQPVVVENRPGASGTIGANLVAKAQPDGYTLLHGEISGIAAARSLYAQLPYDPIKDFVHVTRLVTFPLVVVVPSASSLTSLKELVAQAKAKPGMLRYGAAGVGTAPHLFLEMMNRMAGINTEAIHYKGSTPAMTAMLTGEIDYSIGSLSTTNVQVRAGKFRAIAVTSASAIPNMPNVPPISNVVPGYEAIMWHGLSAPAKTPAPIVAKLQRDVVRAMRLPEVKEHLDRLSMDVSVTTTDEYTAYIKRQIDMWAKVIRTANIRGN